MSIASSLFSFCSLYSLNLVAHGQMGDFSSCVCDYLTLKMKKSKANGLKVLRISSQIVLNFSPLGKRKAEVI